jgi:hypothetical protein
MTTNEICPYCRAEKRKDSPTMYACGTYGYAPPKYYRSNACFESENETLSAENERLRGLLDKIGTLLPEENELLK